jgi:hypothetical protein
VSGWPPGERPLAMHGSWDWLAFGRPPRLWPALWRSARPALLVGVVVFAVGSCLALAVWGKRTPAPDADEIRLLADAASPNLNTTSVEEPSSPAREVTTQEAEPRKPIFEEVRPLNPPGTVLVPTEPVRPLEPEPGVVLIPAVSELEIDDIIAVRNSHPGDTPMLQEWKLLGMQAVLAGALIASTGTAADEKKPSSDEKVDVAAQLKQLSAQMKALSDSVTSIDSTIKKDFERVANDVLDARGKASKAQSDVEALRAEVDRLRKEVEGLRGAPTRVSNYPSTPAGTSTIRLVNTFTDAVTIVINNDRVYHLNPNEVRFTAPLPVGDVTYEVLSTAVPGGVIQGQRTTKVSASSPLTINVFTRQ